MQQIIPISAFKDNYIWLLFNEISHHAWVVDPGDAEPVIQTLNHLNLVLTGILITHHHNDHTGGIQSLTHTWDHVNVIGSHYSPLNSITQRVKEGDVINCMSHNLSIIEIPGHTLDHLAYYDDNILFCGDTLFSFGCGKVFEGTADQMYHSLQKLAALSPDTQLFCGHEYTLANLLFAQRVEPNNLAIRHKIKQVNLLRNTNHPTLPSTLAVEKELNPFLRCEETAIIQAVEKHYQKNIAEPVDVFFHLREWEE